MLNKQKGLELMNKSIENYCLKWAKKIIAIRSLGGKCQDCGEDNIFALEFHHTFADEKEDGVSQLFSRGKSLNKIMDEVSKCELLCSNCHRVRHFSSDIKYKKRRRIKRALLREKGVKSCMNCGWDKCMSGLDFHHARGEKEHDISILSFSSMGAKSTRGKFQLEDIVIEEINKCDVLCSNCHRISHIDLHKYEKLKDIIEEKIRLHTPKPKVDHKKVIDLHEKGHSNIEISKILGCAKSSITYISKKYWST